MGADLEDRPGPGLRHMELSNGALIHRPTNTTSDAGVLGKLIGLLDEPDPNFAVVTP